MKKTKTETMMDFTSSDFASEMAKLGLSSPNSLTKTNSKLAELPKADSGGSATSPFWVMVTMMIITIVISFLPIVDNLTHPFKIFATFIHEISHSIAALLTGGSVVGHSMTVRWDGSGEVLYTGGWSFIVNSAGYLGTTLFGCLMMLLAKSRKLAKPVLAAAGMLVLGFTLIYGATFGTYLMGIIGAASLFAVVALASKRAAYYFMSFLSLQTILNAVYDIKVLFGPHIGDSDAEILAKIYPIAPFIWSTAWLLMSGGMLAFVLINYYKMFKNTPQTKI
jgi:hypothetical protein